MDLLYTLIRNNYYANKNHIYILGIRGINSLIF